MESKWHIKLPSQWQMSITGLSLRLRSLACFILSLIPDLFGRYENFIFLSGLTDTGKLQCVTHYIILTKEISKWYSFLFLLLSFFHFLKVFFWEIFSMYQLWLTGRSIWKSGMSWRHRDVAPSAFRTLGLKAGTTSTWQFNFFFRFFLFSFGLVVLISIF